MLRVFSDAGLPVVSKREDGVVAITIPLPPDDAGRQLEDYLETVAVRERSANVASLRPVFAPAVGRGDRGEQADRERSAGRSSTTSRPGGTRGGSTRSTPTRGRSAASPASPTSPACRRRRTSRCSPSRRWRSSTPRRQCGRRGVRGLVVLTSAVDAPVGADLLAACRRHGMRLIGPNCFGIAVPSIGLDATFAAANPAAGSVGLVMQSGGIGFAMVDHLTRLGIGISSFASVGNKLDVSSNDLLQWWEQDGQTQGRRALHRVVRQPAQVRPDRAPGRPEDAGADRPRGTQRGGPARRRVAHRGGRHPAGHQGGAVRAGGDHRHAELRRADGGDGAARHAAAARRADGGDRVQRRRRRRARRGRLHRPRARRAPPGRADQAAGCAPSSPPAARSTGRWTPPRPCRPTPSARCSRRSAPTRTVHAVIALMLRTGATGDLLAAIAEADVGVPLAVVVLNQPEAVRLVDAKGGKVPAYAYPETAASALSRAVRYAEWRATPRQTVPALPRRGRRAGQGDRARLPRRAARTAAGCRSPTSSRCFGVPDTAGADQDHARRRRRGDRGRARRATRWRSRPRCPA